MRFLPVSQNVMLVELADLDADAGAVRFACASSRWQASRRSSRRPEP